MLLDLKCWPFHVSNYHTILCNTVPYHKSSCKSDICVALIMLPMLWCGNLKTMHGNLPAWFRIQAFIMFMVVYDVYIEHIDFSALFMIKIV